MGKCSVVGCEGYASYYIGMLEYCSLHTEVGRKREQREKSFEYIENFIKEQSERKIREISNKDVMAKIEILSIQMTEKMDKLDKRLDDMDKRLSRIEFSPYPLGGSQFTEILKEEKENGILNKND